jgi:hypothetical protein
MPLLALLACLPDTRLDALDEATARWDGAALAHYRYTLTWACFCPESEIAVDTEVDDGEVVAWTPAEDVGGTYTPRTVDDLFDVIRDAIDADPDGFDVTYDPDLGYSTSTSPSRRWTRSSASRRPTWSDCDCGVDSRA